MAEGSVEQVQVRYIVRNLARSNWRLTSVLRGSMRREERPCSTIEHPHNDMKKKIHSQNEEEMYDEKEFITLFSYWPCRYETQYAQRCQGENTTLNPGAC